MQRLRHERLLHERHRLARQRRQSKHTRCPGARLQPRK
jgi:hypothetical protein